VTLLIDNYDSFTYNLFQYIRESGEKVTVVRNDAIDAAGVRRLRPRRIVVSPGPGRPEDAGNTLEIIRAFAPSIPILGVCLGHQAIAQVFGARVVPAKRLMHGKTSAVRHDGRGVFRGVSEHIKVVRYHSLCVEPKSVPATLRITARSEDGTVMGLRHRRYPVEGVQFHPESLLTEEGKKMIRTFLGKSK
jgi:anthranilate synthase/aminodeoxychorismate synthase-like glutamine amidotransferase